MLILRKQVSTDVERILYKINLKSDTTNIWIYPWTLWKFTRERGVVTLLLQWKSFSVVRRP